MLLRLVQFSLRHRGLVLVLALLVLAYGSFVATRVRLDVFPEFTQPQVDIQTEAPGLAPEQVEQIVTRPVESAVMGTVGLDSVRSESIQGLSVITAVFKEGTDIHQARQNLSERLAEMAGQLPVGVNSPKMSPLTSSTMDLLKVGIVSDKLTLREFHRPQSHPSPRHRMALGRVWEGNGTASLKLADGGTEKRRGRRAASSRSRG